MISYKNDFSFFGYLNTPGCWAYIHSEKGLISWFDSEPNAQFRLIVDLEAEDDCLTFEQLQDLYPGIKTIAIVINPWRKLAFIYKELTKAKLENKNLGNDLDQYDFTDFKSFLSQIDKPIGKKWCSFQTPQSKWLENANDLLHIVRDDYIEEDFKVIQEYFESEVPFDVELFDYKSFYDEETKQLVEEKCKEDIEKFNFKF